MLRDDVSFYIIGSGFSMDYLVSSTYLVILVVFILSYVLDKSDGLKLW